MHVSLKLQTEDLSHDHCVQKPALFHTVSWTCICNSKLYSTGCFQICLSLNSWRVHSSEDAELPFSWPLHSLWNNCDYIYQLYNNFFIQQVNFYPFVRFQVIEIIRFTWNVPEKRNISCQNEKINKQDPKRTKLGKLIMKKVSTSISL